MTRLYALLFLFFFISGAAAFAQGQKSPVDQSKEISLEAVVSTIETLKSEIALKKKQLQTKEAGGRIDEINAEIERAAFRISELRRNFDEIATGVDLSQITQEEQQKEPTFSWSSELRDLLAPLINELKDITRRPREISNLKKEIEIESAKLAVIERGLQSLLQLSNGVTEKNISENLKKTKQKLDAVNLDILTQLEILKQKLNQKLTERKPFVESVERIFQMFFKSRGRNLIISIFAALLFWFIIRKLYIYFLQPYLMKSGDTKFTFRVFQILYYILAIVGSSVVFLVALYLFEDWVLLILAVMLMFGIIWASKEALPKFWGQGTILLNVGPIRENERVQRNGLLWRVKSLNFYSILENPALEGGLIRLPIQDLANLRSRPSNSNEPWFPSQKHDWVLLSDGTYGQIKTQTPEFVQIELLGKSIITYGSVDYLRMNPKNLSKGYRITSSFGLDYQHQKEITEMIPTTLKKYISEAFQEMGYNDEVENIIVEFDSVGASSLNLAVIVDLSGKLADQFAKLSRFVFKICVDASNKEKWVIPFPHLTVHMDSSK